MIVTMARIPRPRLPVPITVTAVTAVTVMVVTAAGWTVFQRVDAGLERAKDRRDLMDLTRPAPWPWEELHIPDGTPREGALGKTYDSGFSVTFPLPTDDDPLALVTYRMQLPPAEACVTTKTRTCTDLGGGIARVITHRTGNSTPLLALYQRRDGRVFSVTALDVRTGEDRLRGLLTRTHRATDEELLRVLRPPGYQTDWS